MKYAIVIPDGCADDPQDALGGKTPLQAARLPNMDRAPLETVAMGLKLGPADWAVRCNLVTVTDGRMHDFTAGHINNADGARLMATIHEKLGGPVPGGELEFHAGVQ